MSWNIFKVTFIFLSTCVFTRIFLGGRNISWIFRENTIASSERLSFFRANIYSNRISKLRWVLILSFPNCVYTWLSIFLSLSPKSETDRKNSCLSTKLNVLCKHIHSVSHMSNTNGILLLFACNKEGFRPWIPITLKPNWYCTPWNHVLRTAKFGNLASDPLISWEWLSWIPNWFHSFWYLIHMICCMNFPVEKKYKLLCSYF